MLKVVHDEIESNEATAAAGGSLLDEIVRDAARQMLAVALRAEVAAYIDSAVDQLDEAGRRLVVRNGHHNERQVLTASGPVPVRAPRVNDRRIKFAQPWKNFGFAIRVFQCERSRILRTSERRAVKIGDVPFRRSLRKQLSLTPALFSQRINLIIRFAVADKDNFHKNSFLRMPQIVWFMHRKVNFSSEKSAAEHRTFRIDVT